MTAGCQLPQRAPNSIHVPLFKRESLKDEQNPNDFASWPQAVQNLHTRELNAWAQRNPDLDIISQDFSFDAPRRVTVTEFHTSQKASP